MKQRLLKCAAVVAGVIFGSNGSFAAENDWTYYAVGAEKNPTGGGLTNCIVKGDWTIQAYKFDAASGSISLGYVMTNKVPADGVLDLRDMSVNGVDITALTLPAQGEWQYGLIQEFYANHVAGTGSSPIFMKGWGSGCSTIRAIEIASDTWTRVGESFAGFCSNLRHLILRCPNVVRYNSANTFINASITNDFNCVINPWATDVQIPTGLACGGTAVLTNLVTAPSFGNSLTVTSIWVRTTSTTLPRVNYVHNLKEYHLEAPNATNMVGETYSVLQALNVDIAALVPPSISLLYRKNGAHGMGIITGELVLTNLVRIGEENWVPGDNRGENAIFQNMGGVKSVKLAGPLKNIKVTFITSYLTNLVLNLPQLESITYPGTSTYPFYFDANGAKVCIYGAASGYTHGKIVGNWTREMVDNLFASFTTEKLVTLHCSKKQGWDAFATPLTTEERAVAPTGCFGVYKSAAGVAKAWMVHLPQVDDPTGFLMRVQ